MTKKKPNTGEEIEIIKEVFGLSHHDSEALLVQAAEVQTTDMPLEVLNTESIVDSTPTTLNDLYLENPSAILDRNAPRK